MTARHFEILVEEPSMEAFLDALFRRALPNLSFAIHSFQGKHDLLAKLRPRLAAYAKWLPPDYRVVVIVDRDRDDCHDLKRRLESIAQDAGLLTRSAAGGRRWQAVNRIAVEELEAWYFGDWDAVRGAYPRAPKTVPNRAAYKDPDAINGTWEAFHRILKRNGYFKTGLRKIEAAREIGARADPSANRSCNFQNFYSAIADAASQ